MSESADDPQPYVEAPQPVPVRALVRGEQRHGWVIGWRGDRVYLRYRTEAGTHLAWVPAADVERLLAPQEAPGTSRHGTGERDSSAGGKTGP